MALTTYKVGDLVYDPIGHPMRILEVQTPFRFRVQLLLTDIHGTPYDPHYAPVVIGRSDIRGGYDERE